MQPDQPFGRRRPLLIAAAVVALGAVLLVPRVLMPSLELPPQEPVAALPVQPAASPSAPPPPAPPPPAPPAPPVATPPAPVPVDVTEPVAITIPAIGVDAEIVPVGLNADGSMEVPDFGYAAWYTEGPKPGATGPAVIVAHVDSRSGPDVFSRLGELETGDQVTVARADGTTNTWTVESSEQVPKDDLPAERIWNSTTAPVLRLITCGGSFDRSVGHYRDNVIVYANPV